MWVYFNMKARCVTPGSRVSFHTTQMSLSGRCMRLYRTLDSHVSVYFACHWARPLIVPSSCRFHAPIDQ